MVIDLVLLHGTNTRATRWAARNGLYELANRNACRLHVPQSDRFMYRWTNKDVPRIKNLVDSLWLNGSVILGGFSDGAALAFDVACECETKCSGLIVHSGRVSELKRPEVERLLCIWGSHDLTQKGGVFGHSTKALYEVVNEATGEVWGHDHGGGHRWGGIGVNNTIADFIDLIRHGET